MKVVQMRNKTWNIFCIYKIKKLIVLIINWRISSFVTLIDDGKDGGTDIIVEMYYSMMSIIHLILAELSKWVEDSDAIINLFWIIAISKFADRNWVLTYGFFRRHDDKLVLFLT